MASKQKEQLEALAAAREEAKQLAAELAQMKQAQQQAQHAQQEAQQLAEQLQAAKEALAAAKAHPQAPPLPAPPKTISVAQTQRSDYHSQALPDIPCSYLYDRSGWADFKKAIQECGLTWNIPHWMTTIIYKGESWRNIEEQGADLEAAFPMPEKKTAGDGVHAGSSELGSKLTKFLKLPMNMGEVFKPTTQFCCLDTIEFEDERRLPARQKLWTWMVKSLRGNRTTIGPYHYLVNEVQTYDIYLLFSRLVDVLEQVTICSLDDELENVIKMDYNPQKQNIFSYLGDLRKAIA